MDKSGAERLLSTLKDKPIEGYHFQGLLGHGKSAAVFHAVDDRGHEFAIKVYDSDLLSKFGTSVQEERFNRELRFKDHSCPNLVKIFGGGKASIDGRETYHLVMEYIAGSDLRSHISPEKRYSDSEIRKMLEQLHSAADYLLTKGCCHRDVKVDNIRIRPNGDAVLLDLGVLKVISSASLTDHPSHGRHFIGTLRYSPPELLHREEADTIESWTAITIYQVGTVLYELIQGVRLFNDVPDNPYADVVKAVDQLTPTLMRSDVGDDLLFLTRSALLKKPEERLKMASWNKAFPERIRGTPRLATPQTNDLDKALLEIRQHYSKQIAEPAQQAREAEYKVRNIEEEIERDFAADALSVHPAIKTPKVGTHLDRTRAVHGSLARLHMIQYDTDLANGIVHHVRLTLQVVVSREVTNHVVANGIGVSGHTIPTPRDATTPPIELQSGLESHWEKVLDDYYEPEKFRSVVQGWLKQMLQKFVYDTKDLREKEIEALKHQAESLKRSGVHVRSMPSEMYWFNTAERGVFSPDFQGLFPIGGRRSVRRR